ENIRRINVNHLALFNTEQCHVWLAFWCDFYGAIMVLATCLLSVAYKESVGSAAVGLAISNTIQESDVAPALPGAGGPGNGLANGNGATSSSLVEIKVADDKSPSPDGEPPKDWPTKGDIRFEKVCLRYYPGAPLALKYVSFHIMDGEKIGVVGRTGSGKTTLLMALFRMFELAYGRIVIDGVNLAHLKLQAVEDTGPHASKMLRRMAADGPRDDSKDD
ncbi:Canalicular multispecific organic anion transporter 1, partial [Tetrabaena socialis]